MSESEVFIVTLKPEYDIRNPFPWYAWMRQNAPVWESKPGVFHVFRYQDVQRALSDYQNFSSQRGASDDANNPIAASLISSDPPRHRQLRTLVSQAFTPRAIADLEPRIANITSELLIPVNNLKCGETFDVVGALTTPLPVIVIAEMLGVPPSDRNRFKVWSDAVIAGSHQLESGEEMTFNDAQREMVQYFSQMIAERRQAPKGDLISRLIQAQVDGQSLSMADILGFCVLLLVAGNETTTNLLSNALYTLHETPGLWSQLQSEPSKIPTFIEEVLRFLSPVQHMYRTTTNDVELSGVVIPKGAHVVAWIGAANRDEQLIEDADAFHLDRSARNLAFGHGIHFCLGAPLARLEAKVALEHLTSMFDGVHIPNKEICEPVPTGLVYGFASMPVQLIKSKEPVS